MSNNSSNDDLCHNPNWIPWASETLLYANYFIMPPVLFVMTWIPGFFTAIAFNRHYRKEEAFIFQRVYVVHICVQCTISITFILGRRFSGWAKIGAQKWFTTNYYLMWYTARFGSPLLNSAILTSLILLTSMALDRLLALAAPMYYQSMNRKRLTIGLITSSYVLGFTTSIFDLPRVQLMQLGDEYHLYTDPAYTSLLVVKVLSMIRNMLNLTFAVLLGLFNTFTMALFVKRSRKHMFQRSNNRERDNRRLERSLLVLTISQGYFVLIEQPVVVATFVLVYIDPQLSDCLWPIIGPGGEVLRQLFQSLNILELYIFNRPFTDMLRKFKLIQYFKRNWSQPTDASVPEIFRVTKNNEMDYKLQKREESEAVPANNATEHGIEKKFFLTS